MQKKHIFFISKLFRDKVLYVSLVMYQFIWLFCIFNWRHLQDKIHSLGAKWIIYMKKNSPEIEKLVHKYSLLSRNCWILILGFLMIKNKKKIKKTLEFLLDIFWKRFNYFPHSALLSLSGSNTVCCCYY